MTCELCNIGRDDGPQGLGQRDAAELVELRQPQGGGGFELSGIDGKDPGAHDLGGVGRLVQAQAHGHHEVRGLRPHECEYTNAAENLAEVWVAARAALRKVLDETSLGHVLAGKLPQHVRRMTESPDAWLPR